MRNEIPEAVAIGLGVDTSLRDAESAHRYGLDGPSRTAARTAAVPILRDLLRQPAAFWERVAERAVQQAITEALPFHWLRRAEELETVGTPWADGAAQACRRHAWLLSGVATEVPPEWLREVA